MSDYIALFGIIVGVLFVIFADDIKINLSKNETTMPKQTRLSSMLTIFIKKHIGKVGVLIIVVCVVWGVVIFLNSSGSDDAAMPASAAVPAIRFNDTFIIPINSSGSDDAAMPASAAVPAIRFNDTFIIPINSSGSDDAAMPASVAVPAETIEISEMEIFLKKGSKYQIQASVTPTDTTDEVQYVSDDENVASVGRRGNILAKKVGKANITVTCGSEKAVIIVNVNIPAETVEIEKLKIKLNKGQPYQIKAVVTPTNTTDKLHFSSDDENVASVDNQGMIIANNGGKANIRVTCGTKNLIVMVNVDVPAEAIEISNVIIELNKGAQYQIQAKATPTDTTDKMEFTSNDENVVSVGGKGLIIANNTGKAKITVTCGGQTTVMTVVVDIPAEELKIDKASITLSKGNNHQIQATVTPSDTTNELQFSSDDENIASVDSKGLITANNAGKTNVTVTCGSEKIAMTVDVDIPTEELKIDKASVTLSKGNNHQIQATVTPSDTTNELQFSSDDENIASVDSKGLITANSGGRTNVIVSCGGKKTIVSITVDIPTEKIILEKETMTLEMGGQYQIKATLNPTDATNKDIEFSTNDGVISVSNTGLITAIGYDNWSKPDVGTAQVNITSGNITETLQVNVINSFTTKTSATKIRISMLPPNADWWEAYPLIFEQTVFDCTGFELTYKVDRIKEGDINNKNWRVIVSNDGKKWEQVGEIYVSENVEKTAIITFNRKDIDMVYVIPPRTYYADWDSYSIDLANLQY